MKKLIAAINMTIDGICDHTAVDPDAEIHQHYADLLSSADSILYGRITYQLMEYWKAFVENPSGDKVADTFAAIMDQTPKIVFSHTLKEVDWKSATLANGNLKDEVIKLKQAVSTGKDIYVGSRSLIMQLLELGLVDELQLCIHPVIAGSGSPLFKNINRQTLTLTKTKTFQSGAIVLYYTPAKSG